MKKIEPLPINVGFDDNYTTLSYKQEAQELYMLLEKYDRDLQDLDQQEINEPNLDLIKNLVNALGSLNGLEFIIALKQIQKLEKPYHITINFSKDLSKHYKNFARVITALKDSSSFVNVVKMLEKYLYSRTLEDSLDKLENNVFDDTADDFISYINGLNVLLEYFKYNVEALWEYLKHFRQRKYILNYDKPFDYLNWHIEQDLFGELKENGSATRTVNVEIFDLKTAKKISTIQIIINLQTAKNEYTQDAYQIGFEPASIEYRYIKADWVKKYSKALVDDFAINSKPGTSKKLTQNIIEILEGKKRNFIDIIEFQKYLISLHNNCWVNEIHERKCQYKDKCHPAPCNKEFLIHSKCALFCYECANKLDLSKQRTRICREQNTGT